MTNYEKLVDALRVTERICRDRMDGQVMLDAAAAIEALQAEIRETMQKCAECCEADGPERGEWELIDEAEPMRWGCSRCKYLSWETSSYCPRCGAKMEVQDGTD